MALVAPSFSFGELVVCIEGAESVVEFWGKIVLALPFGESVVPLVMICACSGVDVLVACSVPLNVVLRVEIERSGLDVELIDCRFGVELGDAKEVFCAERLNSKGDAAPADVVDTGTNERHGKCALGAPVNLSSSGARVHASEGSS